MKSAMVDCDNRSTEMVIETRGPVTARACCSVCARLAFKERGRGNCAFDSVFDGEQPLDIFEVVGRIREREEAEPTFLDEALLKRTAQNATSIVRRYREQLADKSGLHLHELNPNYAGDKSNARVIAPLSKHEVRSGRILGLGGFAAVHEVVELELDRESPFRFSHSERSARQFAARHARRTSHKEGYLTSVPRYAVKCLRQNITNSPERFERAAIDLTLEGQMLQVLDHPNILSLRGWSHRGPDAFLNGSHDDYFLVVDHLGETLDDRVSTWRHNLRRYRRHKTALPWSRAKYNGKIVKQFRERLEVAHSIASAVEYMHAKGIVNRDIKCGNIGFDFHGEVRLFDLGLARILPVASNQAEIGGFKMSRVGTNLYMAPEVRARELYGLAVDVYSFGVVLWEILSLSTPTSKMTKLRDEIQRPDSTRTDDWLPICSCWPRQLQELVRGCTSYNPQDRPSMAEVRSCLYQLSLETGVKQRMINVPTRKRRSTIRFDLTLLEDPVLRSSYNSDTSILLDEHDDL